jgi:hypothetical protein
MLAAKAAENMTEDTGGEGSTACEGAAAPVRQMSPELIANTATHPKVKGEVRIVCSGRARLHGQFCNNDSPAYRGWILLCSSGFLLARSTPSVFARGLRTRRPILLGCHGVVRCFCFPSACAQGRGKYLARLTHLRLEDKRIPQIVRPSLAWSTCTRLAELSLSLLNTEVVSMSQIAVLDLKLTIMATVGCLPCVCLPDGAGKLARLSEAVHALPWQEPHPARFRSGVHAPNYPHLFGGTIAFAWRESVPRMSCLLHVGAFG